MGGYALFVGDTADADVYDASLTKTTVSILSAARQPDAVTAGGYAFFAGGDESSTVDVCDASLTRTTLTALSEARNSMAAAAVGDYVLFAGGRNAASLYHDTVDVYTI